MNQIKFIKYCKAQEMTYIFFIIIATYSTLTFFISLWWHQWNDEI